MVPNFYKCQEIDGSNHDPVFVPVSSDCWETHVAINGDFWKRET